MSADAVLQVRTTDPTPPYEQLRRQLADLIRSGALPPGDRLPPLRQLAADLGLAVGTVARSYRELEAAGLVRSRRGGGTRVLESAPPDPRQAETLLRRAAEEFVQRARLLGAGDGAIRGAVADVLATAREGGGADRPPGHRGGESAPTRPLRH